MTLRAGLSGCGAMGRAAVLQVRGHDHCDIVAVHDPDPEAVRTMRERHGIGFGTTSFDELLSSGVMDGRAISCFVSARVSAARAATSVIGDARAGRPSRPLTDRHLPD